jgi:hypothetical protein
MPQNMTIAAFVFGAVLILVGLMGGRFKVFDVEVSGTAGTFPRIIAFVLGAVLTVVAMVGFDSERESTIEARDHIVPPAQQNDQPPAQRAQRIDISGNWRDPLLGTLSQVSQEGDTFRFTARGLSCLGGSYESSGQGTISGAVVETSYRAVHQYGFASEGKCSGTVSVDGKQMKSACNDSLCSQWIMTGIRY